MILKRCYPVTFTVLAVIAANIVPQLVNAQDGSRLAEGFRRLDSNGDGNLSEEERDRFPRLKTRLKDVDRNGDGAVSFDEFRVHIAGSAPPPRPREGTLDSGDHLRVVQAGDRQRRYRVHVPKSYDGAKPAPVVLAFHGGGGNPESMVRLSGLNDKSEEAGFIVVYPYGSGRDKHRNLTFNGGGCCGYAKHKNINDIAFVRAILDDLEGAASVDPDRIYATGISNGAIMAYYVASELSARIAAIAPVAGPMMTDTCNPTRPVPVMHFHGTADELAPFHGGRGKGSPGVPAFLRPQFNSVEHSIQNWLKANGCNATPKVELLPDKSDDGMRVTRKTWSSSNDESEVVLLEIEGGGHTWPGREPVSAILGKATMDISANDLMWKFFQKHPRRTKDEQSQAGEAQDGSAASKAKEREIPEDTTAIGASHGGAIELLRTPDSRFADLPGYDFEPRYLFVDDPNLQPGNRRIRVHYAVSGPADAPTLLMLHGNPSWSFLFRKIVPPINAAGYRTIMIDYVGHGRSDKPAKESDYTYDRHLEWIHQAFKQLDDDPELALNQVVLFGHDYGHPLGARLMAEHYPERFDGFINGNAGLNRGRWGLARRHQRWRRFVRSVPRVPIGALICRNPARRKLGLAPCSEDVEAGYDAPYPTGDYQASIRAFPEMVPEDATWPEAKANQVAWKFLTESYTNPYMVIWENFDVPDLRNRRDEYISSIPGAFGREQPQLLTGHYSPEDAPEAVAAAIIRFLDDIYRPNVFQEVLRTTLAKDPEEFVGEGETGTHDAARQALRITPGNERHATVVQREPMDLSGCEELKIAFRYLPTRVTPEGKLSVDLWDGAGWANLLALERGSEPGKGDFQNGSTDYGYVRVQRGEAAFSPEAKVRFHFGDERGDASVDIKDVGIYVRGTFIRAKPNSRRAASHWIVFSDLPIVIATERFLWMSFRIACKCSAGRSIGSTATATASCPAKN